MPDRLYAIRAGLDYDNYVQEVTPYPITSETEKSYMCKASRWAKAQENLLKRPNYISDGSHIITTYTTNEALIPEILGKVRERVEEDLQLRQDELDRARTLVKEYDSKEISYLDHTKRR